MKLRRSTGALSGALIMLLGLWGALIPFVGPYFDYSFGTNSAWHYTSDRLWLSILPGAVAFFGGLLLVFAATRAVAALAGWLTMAAGAWFVIGPSVRLTWESASGPIGRPLFGTTRQMLELVGCFYGLGALLVALAGITIGRVTLRRRLAAEPAVAQAAPSTAAAPAAAAAPPSAGAAPRAHAPAPTRRRSLLRRRGREAHAAERDSAAEADRAGPVER